MHFRFIVSALSLASALPSFALANPAPNPQSSTPSASASNTPFDFSSFHFENAVPWLSAGNGTSNDRWASNEFILSSYTLPFVYPRWIFSANDEVQSTPTIEGNSVYVADMSGTVWQLDITTGKPTWQASLPTISGDSKSYSRNSPAIGTRNVIVGDQDTSTLYALSKTDGTLAWKVTLDTAQAAIVTSSPVVVNGKVYVGVASDQEALAGKTPGFVPTFRGSVVALDENTGQILWKTYTVPTGYTGGSVWEATSPST